MWSSKVADKWYDVGTSFLANTTSPIVPTGTVCLPNLKSLQTKFPNFLAAALIFNLQAKLVPIAIFLIRSSLDNLLHVPGYIDVSSSCGALPARIISALISEREQKQG